MYGILKFLKNVLVQKKIVNKVQKKLKKAGFIIDNKQNILKTPEGITAILETDRNSSLFQII